MNPQDSKTIANFFLATLEHEAATTGRVFAAVPEDRLDYRPDAVSKSALELVRHIALEDVWFLDAVVGLEFQPVPDQSDACGIMTPAQAAAFYQEALPGRIEKVKALSGEHLTKEISLMGVLNMPAIDFLSLMVRHSVHHRGQLSAYLRAMGGKVPQIYGPSADEPMNMAAEG